MLPLGPFDLLCDLDDRIDLSPAAYIRHLIHQPTSRRVQRSLPADRQQPLPGPRRHYDVPLQAASVAQGVCVRWRGETKRTSNHSLAPFSIVSRSEEYSELTLSLFVDEQKMAELRKKARSLMMFAGMLRYRMSAEVYQQLT
jgi:hypothetical protein